MRAKWILPLLLALSLVFVITLVLLVVTEQKSKINFNEGLVTLEKPTLRVSQTSQAKEKAINEPVRVDSQGTTEPEPDSSGKNSGKILAEYENYLNTTYLWGTYKPHLIHAFTQRLTKPVTFGFMFVATESNSRLYHNYNEVKSSNGAVFTEYLNHNGKNYSKSIFHSKALEIDLYNYFYKEKMLENRQRWHSITTKDKSGAGYLNNKISVIYYFIIEDFDGLPDDRYLEFNEEQGTIQVKKPGSDPLEYFKIVVYDNTDKAVDFKAQKKSVYVNNGIDKRNTWKLEDIIEDQMQVDPDVKFKMLPNNFNSQNERTSLIAVQLALDQYASFTVHIVHDHWDEFKDVKDNHINVKRIIKRDETHFSPEYNKVFAQIDDQNHRTCALSAFSNLLSGIGYFYGNIEIQGDRTIQPNLPLYTGSPSKSGFPRGFLWDEGFHGLIYCTWNTDICIDILQHWMGTQVDGWIPREQMRGEECRSMGALGFMEQKKNEANPPTLMFLVTALIEAHDKGQLSAGATEMLKGLYPKLKDWFYWFVTSQASGGDNDDKNTNKNQELLYIWKANDANAGLVLGSGLDDYPRGLTGGAQPRGHLDLQLWIVFMAENLVKLADFVEEEGDLEYLNSISSKISNELTKFLDPKEHIYKDLIYKFDKEEYSPHFGYVNLFPLFFGLLKDNSIELDTLLDSLRSNSTIWSNYGLLSLSREDDLYMKTRDSYWGGPIWIPINYLVLRGLKRYYSHNEKAMKIYSELRNNVVTNVCNQKFRNNYFYEQYNQDNGEGQHRFPFTGWTSSVLLMMYEKY